ncbi:g1631 [Coccomyxa viridis]|uniref:Magnesium transporter n=1 Tax=Coccomyxa viridis TaxID=1274662 RepID=A0ABP1FKK6_9CHLO
MVPQIFQRLAGKRPSRQDYESLLLDKNSLSVISEEEGGADAQYASNSCGSLLALHTATARGRREWLFFDSTGTARFQDVNKHELVAHLGIPFRDLRILDPSIPTPSPSSVFIRENAIIFNIESLRMIITKDEVVLLSSPIPGQPLTNSSNPSVDDDFVKEMTAILSGADAAHRQSRVERALPYELRAVEVGLATAVRAWEMEAIVLEHRTKPTLRALLHKMSRIELGRLRSCKGANRKLLSRLNIVKRALQDILDDDDDIGQMYLSRKARIKKMAQAANSQPETAPKHGGDDEVLVAHAEENTNGQHGSDAAPAQDPQPLTLGGAAGRTSSAPPGPLDSMAAAMPRSAFENSSESAGQLRSAPTAPPSEFPSQQEEKAGRPKRTGTWARHVNQIKLAQTLIRLMSKDNAGTDTGDADGEDDDDCADISQAENLLESYFAMVDFLINRLNALEEHMKAVEEQMALELDHRRNELVALDLILTAVATAFAFVSMVGGIYGMNTPLPLWFQQSMSAFPITVAITCIVGALVFVAFVWYARWKRLLFIPDAAALTREPPSQS